MLPGWCNGMLLGSAAAAPIWLPTADASLVGWWDPSDTGTLTFASGNPFVSGMDDKSGFGRQAANGVANSSRPQSGFTLNGLNWLYYDGLATPDFLTPGDHADYQFGTGDLYCVCVVQFDNVSQGVTAQNTFISKNFTGFEMFNYQGNVSGYVGGSSNSTGNVAVSSATPYIIGLKRISGSISMDVNGTDGSATANTASASNAGQGIVFGQRPGAATLLAHGGFIGEIILCSSAAEREKMQGYLAHKWGLEAGLPGGHPYKAAPPPP